MSKIERKIEVLKEIMQMLEKQILLVQDETGTTNDMNSLSKCDFERILDEINEHEEYYWSYEEIKAISEFLVSKTFGIF
jgi:hypothetical protein